jgi:hypothetical protein
MGWMTGVQLPAWAGIFSLCYFIQTGSGAHPTSYPMSTGGSISGAEWLDHEAGHSYPSSADVKEAWSYVYLH